MLLFQCVEIRFVNLKGHVDDGETNWNIVEIIILFGLHQSNLLLWHYF